MSKTLTSMNYNYTVGGHLHRLKNDVFRLPKFQRGFVWEKQQTLTFIDSILQGYPIPSMTFAQLKPDSVDVYLIDGQQRLLSLLFWEYNIFPTEGGREKLKTWFQSDPVWEQLEKMLGNNALFTELGVATELRARANNTVIQSIEFGPTPDIPFDEYIKHLKEIFKRLNLGGTTLTKDELNILFGEV